MWPCKWRTSAIHPIFYRNNDLVYLNKANSSKTQYPTLITGKSKVINTFPPCCKMLKTRYWNMKSFHRNIYSFFIKINIRIFCRNENNFLPDILRINNKYNQTNFLNNMEFLEYFRIHFWIATVQRKQRQNTGIFLFIYSMEDISCHQWISLLEISSFFFFSNKKKIDVDVLSNSIFCLILS